MLWTRKTVSPLPGIELRYLGLPIRSLVTIRTTLSWSKSLLQFYIMSTNNNQNDSSQLKTRPQLDASFYWILVGEGIHSLSSNADTRHARCHYLA